MPTETYTPAASAGTYFIAPANAKQENLCFARVSSRVPPSEAQAAYLTLTALGMSVDTASIVTTVRISRAIFVEGDSPQTVTIGFTLDGEEFVGTPHEIDLSSGGAVVDLSTRTLTLDDYTITPAEVNDSAFGILVQGTQSPANVAGFGVDFAQVEITYIDDTLDAPVLTATATDTTHDLTWTAVVGADGYLVHQSATDSGPWELHYDGTDLEFTEGGLGTPEAWFWRVTAYRDDELAADGVSNILEVTTDEMLAAPENLAGIQPKESAFKTLLGTIDLTWDAVDGAESYDVERRVEDGEWLRISSALETTTFRDATAYDVQDYDYRVRANGPIVAGDWSEAETATVSVGNHAQLNRHLKLKDAKITRRQ